MSWFKDKIINPLKKLWEKFINRNDPVTPPVTPDDPVTPPAEPPVTPPVTPPGEPEGDQTFLWKPVSESRQGRACAIIPAKLGKLVVFINGSTSHVKEVTGPANGNRWHYFLAQTGSGYGNNVKVEAKTAAGEVKRTWTVPNGGVRWASN